MGLKKIKITAIMILFAVLCSACGYRFSEEGGFPGDTDRLFVKVLENRTQETGVENIVTAALLSELTLRKIDNLASGMDNADVVLSGVVEEVAIRTISTRKRDTAGERRVTVSVALKLTKPDGNVVWATKHLSDDEGYSVDANNERTDENRRDAIRVLSRRIAEKVVNRLSDDF
jgi:outer membrane lipopolysaccharide assembly protein LptE/RlpB